MHAHIETVTPEHRAIALRGLSEYTTRHQARMDGYQTLVLDFDSTRELVAVAKRGLRHHKTRWPSDPNRPIDNTNETRKQVTDRLESGWPYFAHKAADWRKPINFATQAATVHATRRVRSVTGGMVMTPSYLAGQPNCMRRTRRVQTDTSVIRMYVDVGGYWGVTAQQLRRRAMALCGLVKVAARLRPLELWVVWGCDVLVRDTHDWLDRQGLSHLRFDCVKNNRVQNLTIRIKIDTTPLDLASVGATLGSTGFFRGLLFAWVTQQFGSGLGQAWKLGGDARHETRTDCRVRELLICPDMTEHDVIIEHATGDEELTDERGVDRWLTRTLDRFIHTGIDER